MKTISVIFLLSFISLAAKADFLFAGGLEARLEQGMDQNINLQPYYDFSLEYKLKNYYFLGLEYFQSPTELTGQQTLNISRTRQGAWLTGAVETGAWGFVSPYLRVGLGGYEDTVTTSFMNQSSTDTSRMYVAGFGGVGLRLNALDRIFVALEARLIFGENLNPQPSPSALFRLGFTF